MDGVKKKILLLSTGDVTGAYEGIYKIGLLFLQNGHTVSMLVKQRTKKDSFIVKYADKTKYKKKPIPVRILLKIKNKITPEKRNISRPLGFVHQYFFISKNETTVNISAEDAVSQIGFVPDIIISGMTDGFINSTDVLNLQKLSKAKVYNITVDMNHFTGGCHYAWDCKGYINGCDASCPAIIGDIGRDIVKVNFDTKLSNAHEGNFQIISGSGWTLKQAKESKIYKDQDVFYNINSLIDTKLFNPNNKDIAKRIFGFDESKFYIMAGCQNTRDPRKGFIYFLDAIKKFENQLTIEQRNKIVIVVVSEEVPSDFELLNFEKHKLDFITDYRLLALLYQAIDLFVNASIEDSGPMMVSEAMASGTPVVGFDMGVVNNMVINDYNGYKATLKDSNDLSVGIKKMSLLTTEEYSFYSKNAVKQIQDYSSFEYATKIFNKIINT